MRSVARRAGVDASLLHHYFGSKADMFAEAIGFPARPDQALARLLAGGPSGVGEPLVRWLLQTWDDPAVQKRGTSILRAALGNKVVTPVVVQFLRREVLGKIAGSLSTDDAGLRSELVASQVIGMLIGRYVVRLPTLRDAGPELLVEWYGPTIQRYLDGASPRGDADRS